MKKIILVALSVISTAAVFAQSLSNSNLAINPSPISSTILVASINITNNTSQDKAVICERTSNILAVNPAYPSVHDSGQLSSFCWDQCYPEWVSVSGGPVTIPANSTDYTSFVGDLATNGVVGTSTVTYSFYVEGNPNDQTSVTIVYDYTTGITTVGGNKSGLSSARPNPADAYTTMTYSLKADPAAYKVELVNMLGTKVAEFGLQGKNGVMTIPTNDLNSGIYFYVLKEYGKTISSQKLVVSHK